GGGLLAITALLTTNPDAGPPLGHPLVNQLQRKLDLAGRARSPADDAESTAPNDVRWQSEIDMIKNVEEFGAKLQRCQFCVSSATQGSVFDQGYVIILVSGAAECITAQSAKAATVRAGTARKVDGDREKRGVLRAPAKV